MHLHARGGDYPRLPMVADSERLPTRAGILHEDIAAKLELHEVTIPECGLHSGVAGLSRTFITRSVLRREVEMSIFP